MTRVVIHHWARQYLPMTGLKQRMPTNQDGARNSSRPRWYDIFRWRRRHPEGHPEHPLVLCTDWVVFKRILKQSLEKTWRCFCFYGDMQRFHRVTAYEEVTRGCRYCGCRRCELWWDGTSLACASSHWCSDSLFQLSGEAGVLKGAGPKASRSTSNHAWQNHKVSTLGGSCSWLEIFHLCARNLKWDINSLPTLLTSWPLETLKSALLEVIPIYYIN